MNRRDFFALAAGVTAATAGTSGGGSYGVITIAGHRAHQLATGETLHVWVDGQDVTRDCYEADTICSASSRS